MPEPGRQATIMVDQVPRVVDLFWDDFDAGAEILGGFHRDVDRWWKDLRRTAEIQSTGTVLFPLPAVALRREPEATMDLLRQFLNSRGWQPPPESPAVDGLKAALEQPYRSILRQGYADG